MEITTTGLINSLQEITSKKLKTQTKLQNYELELKESDLNLKIEIYKNMLRDLEKEETEIRNNWIKILQEAWLDKVESNWVSIRIKTLPWKLIIIEEALIPHEYLKTTTKTTTTVDKKLIKENMKEGEIIDGCKLEQTVKLEVKHL